MARGDFDDLPGAGQADRGPRQHHDPDWWLKQLIEREQITGVLPPALQLRKEDAELDDRSTSSHVESEVRREVEEFNAAGDQGALHPVDGPPLITQPRDVDERWPPGASGVARLAEQQTRRTRAGARRTQPQPKRRWFRA